MNKFNIENFNDVLIHFDTNPIELLGYAKNNIVEVQEITDIPLDLMDKLKQSYLLLDEVQEYLFRN